MRKTLYVMLAIANIVVSGIVTSAPAHATEAFHKHTGPCCAADGNGS